MMSQKRDYFITLPALPEKQIPRQLRVGAAVCISILLLNGCASLESQSERNHKKVGSSYLLNTSIGESQVGLADKSEDDGVYEAKSETSLTRVPTLSKPQVGFSNDDAIADTFSTKASLTIAADKMPLVDFLHYSFGELLQSSYVLGQKLTDVPSTLL
ncbi:hypothetical protein [Shewanella algidipiscicola]|uniref:Uncharacterized protein n=1 Tax=Shewanella algidipiscicola TaxID=614070 RepID=A0ABQ4PEQ3_9GAMM|nr:hypothetical protein [Shewanella algidipiscicola]GIU46047.1 hypothetical protein TUM4630_15580 [Shewanella algidipiscicola]